jgi:transaldolase
VSNESAPARAGSVRGTAQRRAGERRRAVFLDRDGVLNEAVLRNGRPHPPDSVAALRIPPDVPGLIQRLRDAGFLTIAVTNQPDVPRGKQTREAVEAINAALRAVVPLDDLLVCYHDDADACDCRKPGPGLLIEAAGRHAIDLGRSFMIGDRWRDVEAGRRAGCRTVFIDYDYQEARPMPPADTDVRSLAEGVTTILQQPEAASRERLVRPEALRVKLFADGADKAGMLDMYRNPLIKGFTTNPTLMRKAGITDYAAFAKDVIAAIPDRPISFEVFSDEFDEMERQARTIAQWGEGLYVKIPVTNTRRESAVPLVGRLAQAGVKLNVTAVMTLDQVRDLCQVLAGGPPSVVSVFAGRVADTGRDPMPLMAAAVELCRLSSNIELLWASPRELLNIFQADVVGCDIITATNDILKKLELAGKNLHDFSLETVKMFRDDAVKAGFTL